MKKALWKTFSLGVVAALAFAFASCSNGSSSDPVIIPVTPPAGSEAGSEKNVFKDFANYPAGKKDSSGHLTIKNQIAESVLVFTDIVKPENYIGTISANSSITVKLNAEKFYTIVSVVKSAYENYEKEASQTSALTYYSNSQGYTISVSPENLQGSGKWIISNPTKYWVSLEAVDNSKTYAVVQPEALNVLVPIKTDTNYSYKVVYKKELKYQDKILAIADMTIRSQNDTAVASKSNNYRFTTDIPANADGNSLSNNLSPAVYFTNQSGKTVQFFNGQMLLANAASANDEFSIPFGATEMLTGLSAGANVNGLLVKSVAWDPQSCTESMEMKNGKVYKITITQNTDEGTKATKPILWSVTEENGSNYYDE